MKSLELFAGGGGIALGVERAGFRHLALVEADHDACETLRANSGAAPLKRRRWPVYETPAQAIHYESFAGKVHLLTGGPPCQPFSIAGRHAGDADERNMFPELLRAIRIIRPQAVLIENVRGLARATFRPYLDYIVSQLRFPSITPRTDETWEAHAQRLAKAVQQGARPELEYRVWGPQLFDFVNFGLPQTRQRLIFVALRADLDALWTWPAPTHSRDALLYTQWVTGAYWKRHGLPQPETPVALAHQVERLRRGPQPELKPWRTVRDALRGLPEPVDGHEHPNYANHVGIAGARAYYGHSGSSFDLPAKTLKAGVHGVPGGENMLLRDDGSVRYFTVRESARLQAFPDTYVFCGSRSEAMRQIGNAAPVAVAELFARRIYALLSTVNAPPKQIAHAVQAAPQLVPLSLAFG